jgi:Ubiquitin carboxyl-terminal hydrolase
VNHARGAIRAAPRVALVVLDLDKVAGLDTLWAVASGAPRSDVAAPAIELLAALHVRTAGTLAPDAKRGVLAAFLERCMAALTAALATALSPAAGGGAEEVIRSAGAEARGVVVTAPGLRVARLLKLLEELLGRVARELVPAPRFREGEQVLATWMAQTQRHPACIQSVHPDGTLGVLYASGDRDDACAQANVFKLDEAAGASPAGADAELAAYPAQRLAENRAHFDALLGALALDGEAGRAAAGVIARLPPDPRLEEAFRDARAAEGTPGSSAVGGRTASAVRWAALLPADAPARAKEALEGVRNHVLPPQLPLPVQVVGAGSPSAEDALRAHAWRFAAFLHTGGLAQVCRALLALRPTPALFLGARSRDATLLLLEIACFCLGHPLSAAPAAAILDARALAATALAILDAALAVPPNPSEAAAAGTSKPPAADKRTAAGHPAASSESEADRLGLGLLAAHALHAIDLAAKKDARALAVCPAATSDKWTRLLFNGVFHRSSHLRQCVCTGLARLSRFPTARAAIVDGLLRCLCVPGAELPTGASADGTELPTGASAEFFELLHALLRAPEAPEARGGSKPPIESEIKAADGAPAPAPNEPAPAARSSAPSEVGGGDAERPRPPALAPGLAPGLTPGLALALSARVRDHPVLEASATQGDAALRGLLRLALDLIALDPGGRTGRALGDAGLVSGVLDCLFALRRRASPPGTRASAQDTRASPPGTRASPPGTRASPPGTRASVQDTRASLPGTRAGPQGAAVVEPPRCKSPESRRLALALLSALATDSPANARRVMLGLVPLHVLTHSGLARSDEWAFRPAADRKAGGAGGGSAGLANLGCTCYMNANLQQLFMIPRLRSSVLAIDAFGPPANLRENMAYQLQLLFARLQETDRPCVNPAGFVRTYKGDDGKPVDVRIQEDSAGFFQKTLDRVESALKGTRHARVISDALGGCTVTQKIGRGPCRHVTEREESMYGLQVIVKDKKSLEEGLANFVAGEEMESVYCDACGERVPIVKRECLRRLPPTMVFLLKRFDVNFETMEMVKLNSRFEFPATISLRPYCAETLGIPATHSFHRAATHPDDRARHPEAKSEAMARVKAPASGVAAALAEHAPSDSTSGAAAALAKREPSDSTSDTAAALGSQASSDSKAPHPAAPLALPREEAAAEGARRPDAHYQYELRGVVVHTGSLHGGHYYSLIRARAARAEWLEFNDARVAPFDAAKLDREAFGGADVGKGAVSTAAAHSFDRSQNAYILYYDRVAATAPEPADAQSAPSDRRESTREAPVGASGAEATGGSGGAQASAGSGGGEAPAGPAPTLRRIWAQNAARWRDRAVFDPVYMDLVYALVDSVPVPGALANGAAPAPVALANGAARPARNGAEIATVSARRADWVLAGQLATRFVLQTLAHSADKDARQERWLALLARLYEADAGAGSPLGAWLLDELFQPDFCWAATFLLACPDERLRRGLAAVLRCVVSAIAARARAAAERPLTPLADEHRLARFAGRVMGLLPLLRLHSPGSEKSLPWLAVVGELAASGPPAVRGIVCAPAPLARLIDLFAGPGPRPAGAAVEAEPATARAVERASPPLSEPGPDEAKGPGAAAQGPLSAPIAEAFLALFAQMLPPPRRPDAQHHGRTTGDAAGAKGSDDRTGQQGRDTLAHAAPFCSDRFLARVALAGVNARLGALAGKILVAVALQGAAATRAVLRALDGALRAGDHLEARAVFRALSWLSRMTDGLAAWRVGLLMEALVATLHAQARYWKLTDLCLEHTIRLAKAAPVAEWLRARPENVDRMVGWLTAHGEAPALTAADAPALTGAHAPAATMLLLKPGTGASAHRAGDPKGDDAQPKLHAPAGRPCKAKIAALTAIRTGQGRPEAAGREGSDSEPDLSSRGFGEGEYIDCADTVNKWLVARVMRLEAGKVLVHFVGWPHKWNEWVPSDSPRLRALGCETSDAQRAFLREGAQSGALPASAAMSPAGAV